MFYRDLLVSISTLLAYVALEEAEVEKLAGELPKGPKLLLYSCYVLSTLRIGSKLGATVLKEAGKERRNTFCKELLTTRGKKEYLDGEEVVSQWK